MNKPALRMFVDENGNNYLRKDLSNNNNRFLCLTGVVMRLIEHDCLTEKINSLKLKYFGTTEVILHRRELISADKPFEVLKDDKTRLEFDVDMLSIVSELRYGVISIVIDKKTLVDRYSLERAHDPYALALEYLMQRYQYWMQDLSKQYGDIMGDIMAEARGGNEDRVTKETYRLIYQGDGYNKLKGAERYYSSKEIKLKRKKENIAGLQLADLLSHPSRRYILSQHGLANNLSPESFEQSIVEVLVERKFRKYQEKIEGAGAVLFPN